MTSLAVAQMPYLGALGVRVFELQAAYLPASAQLHEHEHPLGVQFAHLLRGDPVALPGTHEVSNALGHLSHAAPFAGSRAADHDVLNLGMRPGNGAEVGAF